MSELINEIDARANLAGTNKLEILLFRIGGSEHKSLYGINVFKVKEVLNAPEITAVPDHHPSVRGMVSLRGEIVPVVDIAKHAGLNYGEDPGIMIVTEYNGEIQGFLVREVDKITRLNWADVRTPPDMMQSQNGGLVTAVTELPDRPENDRLVMLLDVEKIMAEISTGKGDDQSFLRVREQCKSESFSDRLVFYTDDSSVARSQIKKTLDAIGVQGAFATNGRQAWDLLNGLANDAESKGQKLREHLHLILTDVEMPEMDGFALTKKIKSDNRFDGIPVVVHSSLSGSSNRSLGENVGVDFHVDKFKLEELANVIVRFLRQSRG